MSETPAVWLVGAGPGDPELLTLKAVRVIASADVILIDDLVDRRVLAHARPGVRVVHVGKRGGRPSTSQSHIERLLIGEAQRGCRVVRLKGGDPSVLARGSEEIEAIRAAGLHVEIVPGVTAALGAASDLGLSLTDRRESPGVALVTGRAREGGDEPDWQSLARSGLTLVIYMATHRASAIARSLLRGGLPPGTPVVMARNATLESADYWATTLGALGQGLEDWTPGEGLGPPGVLIVGEVMRGAMALSAARHGYRARSLARLPAAIHADGEADFQCESA